MPVLAPFARAGIQQRLLQRFDHPGTTNYGSYDNRNRLLTKATPEGTLTYTYDAHGDVLTINSSNTNGASLTYTYDALNRLASVKDNRMAALGLSAPTTYSYDPVGICRAMFTRAPCRPRTFSTS
jgi:YD repeat-containing protein